MPRKKTTPDPMELPDQLPEKEIELSGVPASEEAAESGSGASDAENNENFQEEDRKGEDAISHNTPEEMAQASDSSDASDESGDQPPDGGEEPGDEEEESLDVDIHSQEQLSAENEESLSAQYVLEQDGMQQEEELAEEEMEFEIGEKDPSAVAAQSEIPVDVVQTVKDARAAVNAPVADDDWPEVSDEQAEETQEPVTINSDQIPQTAVLPRISVTPIQPVESPNDEPSIATLGKVEGTKSFYDLDYHELDRGLSPEQRQEWNSIYASFRGHSILNVPASGAGWYPTRVKSRKTGQIYVKQTFCLAAIPFRIPILIPEQELWMEDEQRPEYVMKNMGNAPIELVVSRVFREKGYAVGSRRKAIGNRRYFFSTRPDLHSPGSRLKCQIMCVGPRRMLVTCNGYDIDMTQRDLSYSAIPNLRDVYHNGNELDCIVKSYNAEMGKLEISVKEVNPNPFEGAQLRHPVGSSRNGVIAGKYAGGVFCNLPDGVVIMCNYSFQYDDREFPMGSRVIILLRYYDNEKKQIYGRIVGKW